MIIAIIFPSEGATYSRKIFAPAIAKTHGCFQCPQLVTEIYIQGLVFRNLSIRNNVCTFDETLLLHIVVQVPL